MKSNKIMETLSLKKVDEAAGRYFTKVKEENLVGEHDMIVFTDDYQFRLANKELVKPSDHILRTYRIDSLGNLWVG